MSIKSNPNENSISTQYKSTLTSIRGHTLNTKLYKYNGNDKKDSILLQSKLELSETKKDNNNQSKLNNDDKSFTNNISIYNNSNIPKSNFDNV